MSNTPASRPATKSSALSSEARDVDDSRRTSFTVNNHNGADKPTNDSSERETKSEDGKDVREANGKDKEDVKEEVLIVDWDGPNDPLNPKK